MKIHSRIKRRYAAFLFVPGREWLLLGDYHESVESAREHLAKKWSTEYRHALNAWVVEVKARGYRNVSVEWRTND